MSFRLRLTSVAALTFAACSDALPPTAPAATLPQASVQAAAFTTLAPLPGFPYSHAYAVGDDGTVVGLSSDFDEDENGTVTDPGRATVWANGMKTDLGVLPGGNLSVARDINASGLIVGYSRDHTGWEQPVIWQGGGPIALPLLPGATWGFATGVNSDGAVVGANLSSNTARAFLWQSGSLTDLGALPGQTVTYAYGINDDGDVVGYSGDRAFLWRDGTMISLGTLPGGTSSRALAINNAGQVTGYSSSSAGTRAFLWEDGVMTDLGTLPEGSSQASEGYAINSAGQVVGRAGVRAAYWPAGSPVELDKGGYTLATALGINDTGLAVGSVRCGSNCFRAIVWDLTPPIPAPPGSLDAEALTRSRISIVWTHTGADVQYFQLQRRTPKDGETWTTIGEPQAGVRSFIDNGLAELTTYRYRIRACNISGCSPWTLGPSVTTPGSRPEPPSNLLATAISGTQIDLTWVDQSFNEAGFHVLRQHRVGSTWSDLQEIATTPPDATNFSDSGLIPGATYYYVVRACNSSYCSRDAKSAVTTTPGDGTLPPAPPQNLLAAPASPTQIDVSWTDNSGDELGFELRRRILLPDASWSSWHVIVLTGPDITAFSNTNVQAGSTYQYSVRACRLDGCSVWVVGGQVTTPPEPVPPTAPTGLNTVIVSARQIDLNWTDASSTETSFRVQRRIRGPDAVWGSWLALATLGANVTHFSDVTVEPETTFEYRVRSCDPQLCSVWVRGAQVTTPSLPAAPANLAGSAASSSRIDLSWTDLSSDETFFRLGRRHLRDNGWSGWHTVELPANSTAYSDSSVIGGQTWEYRLRACSPAGCSEFTYSPAIVTPP